MVVCLEAQAAVDRPRSLAVEAQPGDAVAQMATNAFRSYQRSL
ncbi:MAG: hypothetical protein WEE50_07960 [Chloroflexota bacterium]